MPRGKCKSGCVCGLHKPFSEERRRNLSQGKRSAKSLAFLHGEWNKEHIRQLAAERRGQKFSEEHRRKISKGLTGRTLSEEHRRKVSEINRDPEMKSQRRVAIIARRKPPETHRQVHKRLIVDRGSARNYLCVDCNQPAKDWSHDCRTWENVAQDCFGKRLAFSTDLSVYQPRCHSCHHHLDSQLMPWS